MPLSLQNHRLDLLVGDAQRRSNGDRLVLIGRKVEGSPTPSAYGTNVGLHVNPRGFFCAFGQEQRVAIPAEGDPMDSGPEKHANAESRHSAVRLPFHGLRKSRQMFNLLSAVMDVFFVFFHRSLNNAT
jgi:hypothetical protein